MEVFFHTNRSLQGPPSGSGFVPRVGWVGETRRIASLLAKWDCCTRAPWNLPQSFKYEWMLGQAMHSADQDPNRVIMLADSDTVFQCSPQEIVERFRSFGAQLVVGGERRWFPLPRNAHDPFGPAKNLSFHEKYSLRHKYQFYPNSGLIIGTVRGFRRLVDHLKRLPGFPCCSYHGETGGFQVE
ncbi:MAG: hypothetical protein SGPRY_002359 [Prymnesium sp.]